jgi:hypothetical protein
VPETAVAPEFHQSLYVHRNFSAQLSFNLVLAINDLADGCNLIFSQMIGVSVKVYTGLTQYLSGRAASDPINISQPYFHPFVSWQVNACNPCQIFSLLSAIS